MASSSSEEVNVRRLGTEMGVEITNTIDLVKASNAGQSYLPIVGVVRGRRVGRPKKFPLL